MKSIQNTNELGNIQHRSKRFRFLVRTFFSPSSDFHATERVMAKHVLKCN